MKKVVEFHLIGENNIIFYRQGLSENIRSPFTQFDIKAFFCAEEEILKFVISDFNDNYFSYSSSDLSELKKANYSNVSKVYLQTIKNICRKLFKDLNKYNKQYIYTKDIL